jgi:DNA helicase-2/ATP-dependent DNA helicase PcrA
MKSVNELKSVNKSQSGNFIVGQNVQHDRFGKGKITKLDGVGADQKATIFFPNHGIKNLLLRFANLQILEDDN